MLQRFSVIRGGLEIFAFETASWDSNLDEQLVSGFLEAIQAFSESMQKSIHSIQFYDSIIYIKPYSEFSLRLIFNARIPEDQVELYFSSLSKEVVNRIDLDTSTISQKNILNMRIEEILRPTIAIPSEKIIKSKKIEKEGIKLAIVGLAKVGKTTIKKKFFDSWSKEKLTLVKPTIRIEQTHSTHTYLDESISVFDFGGQAIYRKQYLEQPENFEKITSLVYVIDLKKPDLFEKSKEYFDQIREIVSKVNPIKPIQSIFLHKYDGDKNIIDENLKKCLVIFGFDLDIKYFLTSIEDESSNIALMKALFFSLPKIVIKMIIDDLLLDKIESILLPLISQGEFEAEVQELIDLGFSLGNEFMIDFQEAWLKSLEGNWSPKMKPISAKKSFIDFKGQSYIISIPNWEKEGFSVQITDPIITGMLKGILASLDISITKEESFIDTYSSWGVSFKY